MGGALKTRYIVANVPTPAGTLATAPQVTNVDLGDLILVSIRLRIPSGHAGLTGWQLRFAGVPILPYNTPGAFFIGDDDREDFDVDYEVGNTLQIITYNTDIYPHTHYARMKVNDLPDPSTGEFRPLNITPG